MSADANFASVNPRTAVAQISTANTFRDGTGTGPNLPVFTAATGGSKVEEVRIKAVGVTTAGMVRMYIYDGTGTDAKLYEEIPVSAQPAPGATVETWEAILKYDDLLLDDGNSLTFSTHNGEAFNIFVSGGDFA